MRALLRLLPFPLREKERYFNLAPWEQARAYFSLSPWGEGWGEGVFRARGCSL
jgi:hypothetical protein